MPCAAPVTIATLSLSLMPASGGLSTVAHELPRTPRPAISAFTRVFDALWRGEGGERRRREPGEGQERTPSANGREIRVARQLPLTRPSLRSGHPLPATLRSAGRGKDAALRPGQGSTPAEQAIEKPAVEAAVDGLRPHGLAADLRVELPVARHGRQGSVRQRRGERRRGRKSGQG